MAASVASLNVKAADAASLSGTDPKTAPHSIQAEQALLGALMFNNKLYEYIEGMLTPAHFYLAFHGAVFETMERLLARGWEASPITLLENLRERGEFQEKGEGLEHLKALLENASASTNIKALVEILRHTFLQRRLMEVGGKLVSEAPEGTDLPCTVTLMQQTESELFELAEDGQDVKRGVQSLTNPLKNVIASIETAVKQESPLSGVTTGFSSMNKLLGGFQKSDLIVLAARPSMGKTAFAVNIAYNAASAAMHGGSHGGAGVGVFSLEMSAEQLAMRILSGTTGVDSHRLQQGKIDEQEMDRIIGMANTLSEMPIFIDDTPQLHINMLRSRARRMVRQHNVGMIVVDYLQLMRGEGGGNNFNRVQEISSISMGLKSIARELNVPVIALSQLSRSVESRDNKRPQLSDLRESGSIEQDADIVMFLFREDYYLSKQISGDETDEKFADDRARLEQVRGKVEVIVSKNRKGPTDTINLTFNANTTSYEDGQDAADRSHYGA